MDEEFKISPQMTKKQLIEEYDRLLSAYKKKVDEAQEVEKCVQRRKSTRRLLY